tara:strand:+ start:469 stop:660 length:192 start_codon:yes stop_codon:yes gene_type:complete
MKAVDKIDWELLGEQKLTLVKIIDDITMTQSQYNHLVGIVNILDEMSDEKYFSDKAKKITDKF